MANGAYGAAVVVDDEEDVCRLCFAAAIPISRDNQHPNQTDEDGYIRLEEIAWNDLSKKGFSLVRRHLYSVAKGEAEAQRRDAKRREKGQDARYQLAGTLIARAGGIAAITNDQGHQVFRVLATPTEQEEAHAEVRFVQDIARHEWLRFRQDLRLVLGTVRDKSDLDSEE